MANDSSGIGLLVKYQVIVTNQVDYDISALSSFCFQWPEFVSANPTQTCSGVVDDDIVNFEDLNWGDAASIGDCSTAGLNYNVSGLSGAKIVFFTIFARINKSTIVRNKWIAFLMIQPVDGFTITSADIGGMSFSVDANVGIIPLANLGATFSGAGTSYTDSIAFLAKISTDGNTLSLAKFQDMRPIVQSMLALF